MDANTITTNNLPVKITKVYLGYTYANLLEGSPNEDLNAELFMNFIEQAKRMFGNANPYLVYPNPNFLDPLPPVVVFLKLECMQVFKNLAKDYSSLTVIVFKDDFAFTVDDKCLNQLQDVPFTELCEEHYI